MSIKSRALALISRLHVKLLFLVAVCVLGPYSVRWSINMTDLLVPYVTPGEDSPIMLSPNATYVPVTYNSSVRGRTSNPNVILVPNSNNKLVRREERSTQRHPRYNQSRMKFFILSIPQLTKELIERNTSRASKYYQNHLNEESAEIWLHRAFERMTYDEGHISDPAEADIFLVCGYFHLKAALVQKQQQSLPRRERHPDLSFIQLYQELIVDKTKPHLLLVPSWNPDISRQVGITKLSKAFQGMGINLWSVGFERNKMWQGVDINRIIPIPYVVDPPESPETLTKVLMSPRRRNFVFYAGDPRRHAGLWSGCHRKKLIHSLENETNVDVRIVTKQNRLNQSEYNHRMLSSDYCLILCGDTPSSRSLTSAMVSGCIPIRVGSRLRGLCEPPCKPGYGWKVTGLDYPHLPFPRNIEWDVFPEVNESQFMLENGGIQALRDLFSGLDDSHKQRIRSTMQTVQRGWIYGWGDPVDSMEFGEAAQYIWKSFITTLQTTN